MNDLPAIAGAIMAVVVPLGGAIAFVWSKIEKRFEEGEAKIASAEKKIEDCEQHRAEDEATIDRLSFEVRRDGWAIRLLFQDLHRADPTSVVLKNVGVILTQTYQPELGIPDDFADLLARIDQGTRDWPR